MDILGSQNMLKSNAKKLKCPSLPWCYTWEGRRKTWFVLFFVIYLFWASGDGTTGHTLWINALPVESYRIHSGIFRSEKVTFGEEYTEILGNLRTEMQPTLKSIWNPGHGVLGSSSSCLPLSERVHSPLTPLPSAQLLYLRAAVSASGCTCCPAQPVMTLCLDPSNTHWSL